MHEPASGDVESALHSVYLGRTGVHVQYLHERNACRQVTEYYCVISYIGKCRLGPSFH